MGAGVAGDNPPTERTLTDAVASGDAQFGVFGVAPGVTSHINVQITNETVEPLNVVIPAGTQFVPLVAGYQIHPATEDARVAVPSGVGQSVTVTVPSLCASRFGDQPAPTDGSVPYELGSGPSPFMPLLGTVDGLTPTFEPLAASINMPIGMFNATVAQYAVWVAIADPGTVGVGVDPHDGSADLDFTVPDSGPTDGGGPRDERGPTDGPGPRDEREPTDGPGPTDRQRGTDTPTDSGAFTRDTVVGILGPQLVGQGVPDQQVTQVVTILWGAVDTTLKAVKDADLDGGLVGGLIQGLAGIGAPTTDEHPHTVEKPADADPVLVTTGGDATSTTSTSDTTGGGVRYTVEQMQADRWDAWDGAYSPNGEYTFVAGARIDLANPDYDDDTKRIRIWIISIYEETYKYYRSQGFDNLVAHAMAQIRLDEWRNQSLSDFEQMFSTHIANLGMAISADPLGAYQKLVAEGVAVEIPKVIARSELKGGVTAVATEGETAAAGATEGATARTIGRPAPPPSRAYLLANDAKMIAEAVKINPKPGWFDVICHGESDGFLLNISGKWEKIGAKSLASAMERAGYTRGTPVRLISCNTGAATSGAARQLAGELGVTVEAPTMSVYALDSGDLFVGQVESINGQWQVTAEGHWEEFGPIR